MSVHWELSFLKDEVLKTPRALVILNQPVSLPTLQRLWHTTSWRACADGGANRLYDTSLENGLLSSFIPDLIKGDLDSIREDVRSYYESSQGVSVLQDSDQYATDLMKCIESLRQKEQHENRSYDLIVLGGLSGRLDQTAHTLSHLHKIRKERRRTFVVTDDNVAWVLDTGEHTIDVRPACLGKTCGLLPLGIDKTILTTRGLEWNLEETESSFSGLVSTSNHLVDDEVYIKTTAPIWWCIELAAGRI